ncbi:MAG: hypothetical protein ACKVPY_17785 [Paracoccaceae bacterium]
MNRLLLLAALLGAGYIFLAQSNSPILRQMHIGGGGGTLNPVMGAAAGGSVGGAAVKAAAKIGG